MGGQVRKSITRRRARTGRSAAAAVALLAASVVVGCEAGAGRQDEPAPAENGASPGPAIRSVEGDLPAADGITLHYRVLGDAPDTVVVVHGGPGAGMNSVLLDFVPLTDNLTLIFYDQRGGGRSSLPDTTALGADAFVQDLEAVRSYFGLRRMRLLVHSFGAVLAARYAEAYPGRVDRIVLNGATGPVRAIAGRAAELAASRRSPTENTALMERMNAIRSALLEGRAADPVAACREYEALGRRRIQELGGEVAWQGTTCAAPPDAVRYYYHYTARLAPQGFGDWDFTSGLDSVTAPVLVVAGDSDSAEVAGDQAWADAYPSGRLLPVPGAGKAAIAERPDVVLPAVEEFLRGR